MPARSRVFILSTAVAVAAALAACSSSGGGGAAPKSDSANPASCSFAALSKLSTADQQTAILAGAKKEGSVLAYSSENDNVNAALKKGFEAAYPGIKFNSLQLNTQDNQSRVLTETGAKKYEMDVDLNGPTELAALNGKGVFQQNPTGVGIPAGLNKAYYGSWWAGYELLQSVVTWNTDLVKPGDEPTSYQDLLDPKWKGKVSIDAQATEFISGLITAWGYDKAKQYLEDLVEKNNAQVRVGHTNQSQLLASGEFAISSELFSYQTQTLVEQKAPLKYTAFSPSPVNVDSEAISLHAPHPCAAVLAFEFIAGPGGGDAIASNGRVPTTEGKLPVNQTVEALTKKSFVTVVNPTLANGKLAEQTEQLGEIAGNRSSG